GRKLLGRNHLRQVQLDRASRTRVEVNTLSHAILVSRRIHRTEINVGIENGLDVVIARRKSVQVYDWKCCRRPVDSHYIAGSKIPDVMAEDRRSSHAGLADRPTGFRSIGFR